VGNGHGACVEQSVVASEQIDGRELGEVGWRT
jgi:hypothetical protein